MLCRVYQYVVFLVLFPFTLAGSKIDYKQGWGAIDLHCRNNANEPVDWWFLYKPGAVTNSPLEPGTNFIYFSSNEFEQRWLRSRIHITGRNMLTHTIAPLFRPTYHDHMSAVVYSDRTGKGRFKGTSAAGILMADETGGVWITHSLPDYPNFTDPRSIFPDDELKKGHLIACFSLPRGVPNDLGDLVKRVAANLTYVHLPEQIRPWVPNWEFPLDPSNITIPKQNIQQFHFNGIPNNVKILSRSPGVKRCLYRAFAKQHGIVVDVYGQSRHLKSDICKKDFSVRNIASISVNLEDQYVEYLNDRPDNMRFAVSTAAAWQQQGASNIPQYWTCLTKVDKDDMTGKGGYLLCIENYAIWQSFSNLKVAEPTCDSQKLKGTEERNEDKDVHSAE